ncbi:fibrinogen-like protein 1-like protein isoform X3 [Alligator sinensis]|uniref:Fibrinogen-like protein 1-like protein isoform X3 n=1 Tax=Alligator sinensis TaxID=38654 RepID=A0A3Q0GLI7_ALLSI|nr:fibrinogen-like protein 1-like protein isoform X3 [Alligator sinensis]
MTLTVSEMKLYPFLCFCFAFTLIKAAERETLTKKEVFGNITNRLMIKDIEREVLNIPEGYTYPDYVAKDCRAAYRHGKRQSGLYVIRPKNSPFLAVYCEMDDGGWTVLQRHSAGENEHWSRPWDAYKYGFGHLRGDHWLGNEIMHLLTRQNVFIVRFVFVDSNGHTKHADYHTFKVDSEKNGYALRLGDYSGDAGDALTTVGEAGIHDNMNFSTLDKDHDRRPDTNCAEYYHGGWWYDDCYSALLNSDKGIYWKGLCTAEKPCKSVKIMIRPNPINCKLGKKY